MKTLLLLGGSAQQVVAIETARRLGYRTVLCDYLPDNPGQFAADIFYPVSTTDTNAVLEIARAEHIDGILAYASDPAAPTAAFVAEKLGLPGNPCHAVEILCNKDKFRAFLAANGFNAPGAKGYSAIDAAIDDLNAGYFALPAVVKPVDSSGSKGITVLRNTEAAKDALEAAFSFSRQHRVIVEEFIEKKHPFLIGGDIFVLNGQVVLWGLLNCLRDESANPLVPAGKSYPLMLDAADEVRVKEVLQSLVSALGIRAGAMNVEVIVDAQNRVWPIDIGPRSGGNMIPELLNLIFGVDIVEMTVQTAMGEPPFAGTPYYATYNLHAPQAGILKEISFAPELKPYIVKVCLYKKPGDQVETYDNAAKVLGILFLRFGSMEKMNSMLAQIKRYIFITTERGGVICLLDHRRTCCRSAAPQRGWAA